MSESQNKFTQALADEICARLSLGEPLAHICRDAYMPATRTVRDWKARLPEFKSDVDDARDDGYDFIANRLRSTARGLAADKGGDSTQDVQRDKLIIHTDLQLLAKWDQRRYGDKLTLAGDADNPLGLVIGDARAKLAKRLGVDPETL
jgi:hypothetical protein